MEVQLTFTKSARVPGPTGAVEHVDSIPTGAAVGARVVVTRLKLNHRYESSTNTSKYNTHFL